MKMREWVFCVVLCLWIVGSGLSFGVVLTRE